MGSRRKARETLLKAFYLSESRGITIDEAFAEMKAINGEIADISDNSDDLSLKPFALGLDNKQHAFALRLAHTIERSKELFNNHIKDVLQNWDFSRVSRIDRIIMWIALAEISSMIDIPPNVSINEAIELAKKYSSLKSPSFVNGILDSVARNMGVIK
ncbi:MAG TPA: transcription antitermination factor NusB [Anaerolineae bacterium]|nr:transcription antitermination factor NusB [Anaerolineae bacterium]